MSEPKSDMNQKIQGIAKGIVDKWVREGLTITKDKVEGWIDILDKAETQGQGKKQKTQPSTTKKSEINGELQEVRDTVVHTFSNIGKVKCTDCEKNNLGSDNVAATVKPTGFDAHLESLSIEDLQQKQDTIKQLMKMEKMSKLAKLKSGFGELEKMKNIVDLAKTLQIFTTPREEL